MTLPTTTNREQTYTEQFHQELKINGGDVMYVKRLPQECGNLRGHLQTDFSMLNVIMTLREGCFGS